MSEKQIRAFIDQLNRQYEVNVVRTRLVREVAAIRTAANAKTN